MDYARERTDASAETVSRALQTFRECQRLRLSLRGTITALASMTQQKSVLESAVRRCGGGAACSSVDAVDELRYVRAMTAPLGALMAFPHAYVEHLIGQHQTDVSSLLHSMTQTQQDWMHKTDSMRKLVNLVTSGLLKASTHTQQVRASSHHTRQPVSPRSGSEDSCCLSAQTVANQFGLEAAPQLIAALHALLSVLSKMSSVLQESVLALRNDMFAASAGSSDGRGPSAVALMTVYTREEKRFSQTLGTQGGGLLSQLPRQRPASFGVGVPAFSSPCCNSSNDNRRKEGNEECVSGRVLSLLDALEQLPEFIDTCWSHYSRAFFTTDTHILLA